MSEYIKTELADGVLTLTLNRPEKRNALTPDMYRTLADAIDGANEDEQIRCVLLQAEGELFCSGNDLADFAAANANSAGREPERRENPLLIALGRAQVPLVAAVQGRAVGVGTTMLLHFDLVYLSEDALLTTPFVNLALVPEAASSLTLTSRIGHARAFAMFVLGQGLDAKTAVDWGVANAVVAKAELRAKARDAALQIASKPPSAVRRTKALMRDPEALAARMRAEGVQFGAQLQSAEAAEAFAAFRERRPPDFTRSAARE